MAQPLRRRCNLFLLAGICMVSGVMVYALAYTARFSQDTKHILTNSLLMAIRHLPKTLLLIIILAAAVLGCYLFGLAVVFVPAVAALLDSLILESIFVQYMSKEDLEKEAVEKSSGTVRICEPKGIDDIADYAIKKLLHKHTNRCFINKTYKKKKCRFSRENMAFFLNLIVKILLIKQSICVKIGANRENASDNDGNSRDYLWTYISTVYKRLL